MTEQLQRIIRFRPAYDYRKTKPGGGRCDTWMYMVAKGERGAVCLMIQTGWELEWEDRIRNYKPHSGGAVSTHCPHPYDSGYTSDEVCEWLDGKPCWGDVCYSASNEMFDKLVADGDEAVWEELEKWYYEYLPEVQP